MASTLPGWPCHGRPDTPPSVADRQSHPTADDLLPQVLALTPRGPAWGTDEAGDGKGASPWMRRVWRAVAAWAADDNRRDFAVATQVFPSAVTFGLPDWEVELGLPDPCTGGEAIVERRLAAVRARFAAQGGASPAYFVCLAKSLGYDITIEEPTQFMVDVSELGPDPIEETWFEVDDGALSADTPTDAEADEVAPEGDPLEGFRFVDASAELPLLDEISDQNVWQYWIVRTESLVETWFTIDDGEVALDSIRSGVLQPLAAGTPLEGFVLPSDLECLMRRLAPAHTTLVFQAAAG